MGNWILQKLMILPGIVVGLSLHEFGHAKVAELCGDDTARRQGRVSINPLDHIDPFGLISLFIIGFGWGKPVMVNPAKFKNPRRDSIFVGLAGVCMNFLAGVVFAFIVRLIVQFAPLFSVSTIGRTTLTVLMQTIIINISLMLFNLIPVPPLDGFGVISDIVNLPRRNFRLYLTIRRYGYWILLLIIAMGLPSRLLSTPLQNIYSAIMNFAFIGM